MKVHLQKSGTRTVCRYTSQPSRRVKMLPLLDFLRLPEEQRCRECAAKAKMQTPNKN
jgi:hypothetical protein